MKCLFLLFFFNLLRGSQTPEYPIYIRHPMNIDYRVSRRVTIVTPSDNNEVEAEVNTQIYPEAQTVRVTLRLYCNGRLIREQYSEIVW